MNVSSSLLYSSVQLKWFVIRKVEGGSINSFESFEFQNIKFASQKPDCMFNAIDSIRIFRIQNWTIMGVCVK